MNPSNIYYEPGILDYELGITLKDKFRDFTWTPIENHNNIPELRAKSNADFVAMKNLLIIGTRKTHKYVPNKKISDFLVPFTSSGCSAMCLYCYLVCNYNKCSYLRLFVNREQMLDKLLKTTRGADKNLVFEIGSNSDLVLENRITGNLPWVIENFGKQEKGYITFPTKFSNVDSILDINHRGRTIFRMSVNPQEIISQIEIGTSNLQSRIKAINKVSEAGYKTGILIAPVVMVENWESLYTELLDILQQELSPIVKKQISIEVIFMTYSYVQKAINDQAFPASPDLYNKDLMTGRGMGKYCYRNDVRAKAEVFLSEEIEKRFSKKSIVYIV